MRRKLWVSEKLLNLSIITRLVVLCTKLCAGCIKYFEEQVGVERRSHRNGLWEYGHKIFKKQYRAEGYSCQDVYYSRKDYLPRWFTDYVFELFKQKTYLKGADPTEYALAKGRVNSCYGCMVQKALQEDICEDYQTGEYYINPLDPKTGQPITSEKLYEKYLKNRRKILPYQWGVGNGPCLL